MECPACGGKEFDEGSMAIYNSISYLVYSSKKEQFLTLGNSLKARVCLGCGRLDLFAPAMGGKSPAPKKMAKGSRGKGATDAGKARGGK
jgi:hypothetical protein